MHEYELQAVIEYVFRLRGSPRLSYPTIVAGADNATILHYNTNRMRIPQGSLVLIDAGCELDYQSADITRTFPIDGVFEGAARDVYSAVLDCQVACVDAVKAGESFQSVHDLCVRKLVEAMVQFGWLQGEVDGRIEDESYKRFYMHRTSHWLGMDVHDAGRYRIGPTWRTLEPGMVLTVEPGLYVLAEDETVDPAWRGLGVRIEDDVAVTADGPANLTAACPKSIEDIEAMMRQAPRWVCEAPAVL
jgi:Xaa-Pro aminopeptidase